MSFVKPKSTCVVLDALVPRGVFLIRMLLTTALVSAAERPSIAVVADVVRRRGGVWPLSRQLLRLKLPHC